MGRAFLDLGPANHRGAYARPGGSPGFRLHGSRGFTLVELLVVISIIALLISLMLPSLRKAREIAKTTVCLSNMRQMGISLTTYAFENNDYIPAASCASADSPEENYWLRVLQGHAKQPLIAKCPKDKTKRPFLDWGNPPADRDTWLNYRWSSYAINFCLVPTDYHPHEYNRLNRIPKLVSVIYLAEIRSGDGYDAGDHIHADQWETPEAPTKAVAWDRHLGKSNYLFTDSHVDTLPWKKTWEFPSINLWWPSHAPGWDPVLLPEN